MPHTQNILKQFEKLEFYLDRTVLTITIWIALVLVSLVNNLPEPNSDIFQYISDGKNYINFTFPDVIHSPPANPLLLTFLSMLFTHPHREILAARLLNILLGTSSVYLMWIFSKKYFGIFGLLTIIFIATNPLFNYVILNTTSEPLFGFTVFAILLLKRIPKQNIAYFFSGLSILVRFEAICLLAAMTLGDVKRHVQKKPTLFRLLLGIIPIALWLVIISKHNHQKTFIGNPFLQEIITKFYKIPNWEILQDIPKTFLLNHWETQYFDIYWAKLFLYLNTALGIWVIFRSKYPVLKTFISFSFFYLLAHILFPEYGFRYSYQLLWPLILINLWPFLIHLPLQGKLKVFIVASQLLVLNGMGYVVGSNLRNINQLHSQDIEHSNANTLVAKWVSNKTFSTPVTIITLEPWIGGYYNTNPGVTYYSFPLSTIKKCHSIPCLIGHRRGGHSNERYLVVKDNWTENSHTEIAQDFGVELFRSFDKTCDPRGEFKLIANLGHLGSWAMIYEFIPRNG
ncbi:hypothetical protein ACFL2V_18555 [Pseudomonadota bacterium]